MYLLTSLSFEELGKLVSEKRIELNNSKLFVRPTVQEVDDYFRALECGGYVLGIGGLRMSPKSVAAIKKLTKSTKETVVLEVEVDTKEGTKFSLDGIDKVTEYISCDMDSADIVKALNEAKVSDSPTGKSVDIVCYPTITNVKKVRIACLDPEFDSLVVDCSGVTVVDMTKECAKK